MTTLRALFFLALFQLVFMQLIIAQSFHTIAPDFSLEDINGQEVNLYDSIADGKVVFLYFFSVNCGSCHLFAPIVDSVFRQFGSGSDKVTVWGIVQQDYNSEEIQNFIDDTQISFRCFPTGHATDVFELYNINYTPQLKMVCDYVVSESIPENQIVETLSYCISVNSSENKNENFIISLFNNILNIEANKKILKLIIYDISGQIIFSVVNPENNLFVPNLNFNDLYIINVIFDDNSNFSTKLISR